MRENCSVGCEQEGCFRLGEPEQKTTGSSELKRSVREGVYTERLDDRYGGRVPLKIKNKNKN